MWQRLGTIIYWIVWSVSYVYLRGSARTRLLLVVGDEILLTRTWLSDGRWSLPGGGLHRGEAPLDGVIREVREETNIILEPKTITQLQTERYHGNGQSFLCHYFMAELPEKPAIKLQRLEISASQWADPSRRYG